MNVKYRPIALALLIATSMSPAGAEENSSPGLTPPAKIDSLALAKTIHEELRIIDAIVDQWAIENNLPGGARPTIKDMMVYCKPGTRLFGELLAGRCTDSLGNPISIPRVDAPPRVSRATFERLSSVAPEGFWTSSGFQIEAPAPPK